MRLVWNTSSVLSSQGLLDGVDPEVVAVATLVTSNLRRTITAIDLRNDASIAIDFGDNRSVEISTDAAVVDWQWSLGRCPQNPYATKSTIACLWKGEVEI